MSKPNILLTFADDQRHTMLGCCDGPTADGVRTPHLDALAQRGCRFTHAYHAGSPAGAVCVPSRAMLHSGCGPFDLPTDMVQHGLGPGYSGRGDAPLLGQLLHEAGYTTHLIGKWHNGQSTLQRSFDSGEGLFLGGMSDHFNVQLHHWDGRELAGGGYMRGCHSSDIFGETARQWLYDYKTNQPANQPFFLCVAFTAPHDPRQTHPQWHKRYAPENMELAPNCLGEHPFDNGAIAIRDELLTSKPREDDQTRRELADYYAMTEHMDHEIGRIHEALADLDLQDNTLVIHSGDHGLAVGQHGLMGKQNLYDHSVRVPLIVAGPNIAENQQRNGLCYQHDLFPTLLETAHGAIPQRTAFCSLWPMLNGEKESNYETIGSYYADTQRMITDGHSKIIRYRVQGQTIEQRFDLDADPWEQIDGQGRPLKPSNALDDSAFTQWQKNADDPWLDS